METISEKTERAEHSLTFKELYQGLVTCKKLYTCHKFQVFNDQFHWANSNCDQTSEINYMDFPDDLSQQYKYEPQSCHFSKQQYSLCCTVKHTCCENYPHEYFYQLSGDMRHNFAFTSSVVYHSVQLNSPSVTCFKYDNCLTQYKTKYVFKKWQALAIKTKKLVIVYYSASGHGKVLVDTVSEFAVKGPLQKAVKTFNFSYSNAVDIYNFLTEKFSKTLLSSQTRTYQMQGKITIINNIMYGKAHDSIFPDGSIQTKTNLCLCNKCIKGDFIKCLHKFGKKLYFNDCSGHEDSPDAYSEDEEFENEDGCYDTVTEENQIRAECVVDTINPDSLVALCLSPQSFEMFFVLRC